jgi:hypothetical protein
VKEVVMDYRPLIRRILICAAISIVAVFVVSEVAFLFQADRVDRGPQTITLEIPAGSAALVSGGMTPPDIPDEMTFVTGDELLVVNHDDVDHQLGPIWVPPGESASLRLGKVEHVAFACSFQPTRYMGIQVKEPTTIETRLLALAVASPPTAAILLVYSVAAFPLVLSKKPRSTDPGGQGQRIEAAPMVETAGSGPASDKSR